ncbi:MAG: flagellar assembly protein FliH [Desulfovibrio sp.]|uniref:FliH/SctL family protein n=1 Tax=Desulfovibrio sp. TaxID=885 RepID=UPI001A72C758|nr:FliH/SctL family protein [Desulfovibrio sp.]MBD5416773.1 flagellar assembly protein FliH [Desulfovibrio sp.]
MASEQLRKKWGTIFMGEREATVDQLDAMQEPMRREKLKQEQEADYMERVRARAAERAKEILGAAYAERLKVLDEARAETDALKRETAAKCAAVKAEAEALRKEAQAELARAQAEREAAVRVREAAHGEGYQAGMDQAGQELREFRAELGQSLGALLRAIAGQRADLAAAWREELVELTQEAVAAGTGHVLSEDHAKLLRALVLKAVGLLEDRATIVVRVNPADEAAVGDMFAAARERAPELVQWIVNGDERMEPGGLVAESGSGSVDCRREHFREMVDSILSHLTLPEREGEAEADEAIDTLVEHETARMAELAPPPEPALEPAPAPATDAAPVEGMPEQAEDAAAGQAPGAQPAPPQAPPQQAAPTTPPPEPELPPDLAPDLLEDGEVDLSSLPPDDIDMGAPEAAAAFEPAAAPQAPGAELPAEGEDDGLAWLPPLGDPGADGPGAPAAAAEKLDPSLAELEEELFPLDAPEAAAPAGGGVPAPGVSPEDLLPPDLAQGLQQDERDEVLAHGGFLPGN